MKMLLITDRNDAMIGLRLAGVETVLVRDKENAEIQLQAAAKDENTAVLLVTRGIEKMCAETLSQLRRAGKPLISTVPDSDRESSVGGAITDYIANAIGFKID